jgi:O-antigen/teichoic acid export membrane protein
MKGDEPTPAGEEMAPQANVGSLRQRYAFKLGANVVVAVTGLVSVAIIPRLLGAERFGIFNFLVGFFPGVLAFMDPGISKWYSVRLAQSERPNALKGFFWALAIGIVILLVLITGGAFAFGLEERFWPGVPNVWIWTGMGLAAVTWVAQLAGQTADAEGHTIEAEKLRVVQKLIGIVMVLALFVFGLDKLGYFYAYHFALHLIWICGLIYVFRRAKCTLFPRMSSERDVRRDLKVDMMDYIKPLIVVAVVTSVALLANRWLLQNFGGSREMGYFGLGQSVATMCFLFIAPMIPLLSREIARAHAEGDLDRLRDLLVRAIPGLVAFASLWSFFFAVNAASVVRAFGGSDYEGAGNIVAVMALYPILQTMGQILGVYFYATSNTRIHRNLTVTFQLVGVGIAWWLIAPTDLGGLGLAGKGLAMQLVIVSLLSVSVRFFVVCRLAVIGFLKLAGNVLLILGVIFGVSCLAKVVGATMDTDLFQLILSGVIHCSCIGLLLLAFPTAVGLSRSELLTAGGYAKKQVRSLFGVEDR